MTALVAGPPGWTQQFSGPTVARLESHLALLNKWNGAINLVAQSSLGDAWARHVLDSVQVFALRGESCHHWADLGSGAGFPGMVVALLAFELAPQMRVSLIEADHRKAEFLRVVSRETGVPVNVIDSRIEGVSSLQADRVSARALAPLPVLCRYASLHLAPGGRAIFPKGAKAEEEIAAARADWRFTLDRVPSLTDPAATVLVLEDLHRG